MLRPYQSTLKIEIERAHADGKRNVLAVMPTGAGKTVVMSEFFRGLDRPSIAIAHRQELVSQISTALARAGVYHRIIAPDSIIRFIVGLHVRKFGRSFYHPGAPCAVAGVDTLVRRTDTLEKFLKQVVLWQCDEGHHLTESNKWGKAVETMPQALGIGWTATPVRMDKKSLKRGDGGVFDHMCVGPSMRALIQAGYLTDYKIFAPPSDLDMSGVKVTQGGDFNGMQLSSAVHKSRITGDLVAIYQKHAAGKRAVTFAVDVGLAHEHAEAFRAAGVPAAVMSAKTPDRERQAITDQFERGELLQIVNVDILGEGFDMPAIEVVQMARPTASYGLFVQQFGRALRLLDGKRWGLLFDHVGNVVRHGLPDATRSWSLTVEERRPRPLADDLPVKTCPNPECFRVFEGFTRTCPFCGFKPEAQDRTRPELVDGDLTELDPSVLAKMRGEAEKIVAEAPFSVRDAKTAMQVKNWEMRRDAQLDLREAIAWWAGVRRDRFGDSDSASYQRFFRTFGVDVIGAQALGAPAARELCDRIWAEWSADLGPSPDGRLRRRSSGEAIEIKTALEYYAEAELERCGVVSFNKNVMVKRWNFENATDAASMVTRHKSKLKLDMNLYRLESCNQRSSAYSTILTDEKKIREILSELHDGARILLGDQTPLDLYTEAELERCGVVSFNKNVMANILKTTTERTNGVFSHHKSKLWHEFKKYRLNGGSSVSSHYSTTLSDENEIRRILSELHDGAEIILIDGGFSDANDLRKTG